MRGFHPQPMPQDELAAGGLVQGPGTGTSDSIPAMLPDGGYVMPADSTAAIGAGQLAAVGQPANPTPPAMPATGQPIRGFHAKAAEKAKQMKARGVPARVSDGEFILSPEQVANVGRPALDQLRAQTHTPVPENGPHFFVNGGFVDDDELKQANSPKQSAGADRPAAGRDASPNSFGDAAAVHSGAASQTPAEPPKPKHTAFPRNSPDRSIYADRSGATPAPTTDGAPPLSATPGAGVRGFPSATTQGQLDQMLPNTRAAWNGLSDDVATAYKQGGVGAAAGLGVRNMAAPVIGLVDDFGQAIKPVLDPLAQGAKTLVTGDSTPIGQEAASPAKAVGVASLGQTKPADPVTANAMNVPQTAGNIDDITSRYGVSPGGAGAGGAGAGAGAGAVAGGASGEINGFKPVEGVAGAYRRGNEYTDNPAGGGIGASRPAASAGNLNAMGNWGVSAADLATNRPQSAPQGPRFAGMELAERYKRELASRNAAVGASSFMNKDAKGNLLDSVATRNLVAANQAEADLRKHQSAMREGEQTNAARFAEGEQREVGADRRAFLQERGLTGRAAMSEEGQNARANESNRITQAANAPDIELKGFQVQAARQVNDLRMRHAQAQTPEQRADLEARIAGLIGKPGDGGDWAVQVTPATKNLDGSTSAGSVIRYNKRTGEVSPVNLDANAKVQQVTNDEAGKALLASLPKGARYMGPDGKFYTKE